MDLLDKVLDEMEEGCDTPSTAGRPHANLSGRRMGLGSGWASDLPTLGEPMGGAGQPGLS